MVFVDFKRALSRHFISKDCVSSLETNLVSNQSSYFLSKYWKYVFFEIRSTECDRDTNIVLIFATQRFNNRISWKIGTLSGKIIMLSSIPRSKIILYHWLVYNQRYGYPVIYCCRNVASLLVSWYSRDIHRRNLWWYNFMLLLLYSFVDFQYFYYSCLSNDSIFPNHNDTYIFLKSNIHHFFFLATNTSIFVQKSNIPRQKFLIA